jgi:hypothetical protein
MARPRKATNETQVEQPIVEETVEETVETSTVEEVVDTTVAQSNEESTMVFTIVNDEIQTATPLSLPEDWFEIPLQDWYKLIITRPNEFLRVNVYLEHDGDRIWLGDSDVTIHTTESIAMVVAKRVAMNSLVELQKMVNRANQIKQL